VKEGYAAEAPVIRGEEIGGAKLNTNTMWSAAHGQHGCSVWEQPECDYCVMFVYTWMMWFAMWSRSWNKCSACVRRGALVRSGFTCSCDCVSTFPQVVCTYMYMLKKMFRFLLRSACCIKMFCFYKQCLQKQRAIYLDRSIDLMVFKIGRTTIE
jgi:hypothetical protein